jgi:hypothetical protein
MAMIRARVLPDTIREPLQITADMVVLPGTGQNRAGTRERMICVSRRQRVA